MSAKNLWMTIPRCAKFATLSNDKNKQMNFGNIVIMMNKLAQNQKTLHSGIVIFDYFDAYRKKKR